MTGQLRYIKQFTGQALVNQLSVHTYPERLRFTCAEQEATDPDRLMHRFQPV